MLSSSRFLLGLALAVLLPGPRSASAAEPPSGVMEAFLQVPPALVFGMSVAERRRSLDPANPPSQGGPTLDERNGYLLAWRKPGGTPFVGGAWLELAVFPAPANGPVVGISLNPGPPPVDSLDARFFRWDQGAWTDVTSRVLPKLPDSHGFKLPRRGTTLEVRRKEYDVTAQLIGPVLYRLDWKDGRFVRRAK